MRTAVALCSAASWALACAEGHPSDGPLGASVDAAADVRDAGGRPGDGGGAGERADAGGQGPGGRVAFSRLERGRSQIFIMNEDGTGLSPLSRGDGSDHSPSWSPSGRQLAYTSSRGGAFAAYVLDVGTGATSSIAPGLFRSGSPAWHPTRDLLAIEGLAAPGQHADIYTSSAGGLTEFT